MKKLVFFLWVVVTLLSLSAVSNAHAKSSENKANCLSWCNSNKPRCAFCDADVFCEGRTYDIIKSFKKGTGNWYACGLSNFALNSRENERQCKQWCNSNAECEKCTSGACGRGIKLLRRFGGSGEDWRACQQTNWARNSAENERQCKQWCSNNAECKQCTSGVCGRGIKLLKTFGRKGKNWHACQQTNWARNSRDNERRCKQWCTQNQACEKCTSGVCGRNIKLLRSFGGSGENWRACQKTNWARGTERSKTEAEKWCADYKQSTGEDCRIVKSGKSCPNGYYKSDRLKFRGGRDYKVCLVKKSGSQRVKDCTAKGVVNIEKALTWINTHYNTILGDFRLQPRDYRNRRARERYDRKFPKVTVTCEDHRNKCKKSVAGWSAAGRKIHLCYSKHSNFCDLVGTIFHEGAHNAWVDDQLSQHIGDPGSQDDTVYQLGFRAQDLCYGNNTRGSNILPSGRGTNYNFTLK